MPSGSLELLLKVSTVSAMLYGIQQRKKTTSSTRMNMTALCFRRPLERSRIQEQQVIRAAASRKLSVWWRRRDTSE